jgi:hypothetical protein
LVKKAINIGKMGVKFVQIRENGTELINLIVGRLGVCYTKAVHATGIYGEAQ